MDSTSVSYRLDPETSAFVITDYNRARPFSNFLPGIAGLWGVPLWAYYVSRGQGVCSAGVRDKDGQILEFQSFNLACMRVEREGFRTFFRVDGGEVYEPFRKGAAAGVEQTMTVSMAELAFKERNEEIGLEVEVAYAGLSNRPYAGLVRDVRVRNLKGSAMDLEWLDGAARVLPYGLDQERIKGIPRHIEAMMGVSEVSGVPLFRLKQTPADSEQVGELRGGHFYLAAGEGLGKDLVTDPAVVFSEAVERDHPWVFAEEGAQGVLEAPHFLDNRTPCAFTVRTDRLEAGAELRHGAVLGAVREDADIKELLAEARDPLFYEKAREESRLVIAETADPCFTLSGEPLFDAHCRQSFLDNVMRGGRPVVFDTAEGKGAVWTFSRQNGDLERDYHFFVLEPTYLSQGTGHYRSVLQNRRCDTFFYPEVGDANLRLFAGLLQLDGYNPLEVNQVTYRVEDGDALEAWASRWVEEPGAREQVLGMARGSFSPGELAMRLERGAGVPRADLEAALKEVLGLARQNECGGLHEGFWADHWHYVFDLLELYLVVYPDRLREVLLGERAYRFFDDPDVVLPRSKRIVRTNDGRVRSYGAVVRDEQKLAIIAARDEDPYSARAEGGAGEVYKTTLLVKLLSVAVNRTATLDPSGVGVEMEAGKPGWNDSMNGLPGLFGSGLSETMELRRALRFLHGACKQLGLDGEGLPGVFVELKDLMSGLRPIIRRRLEQPGEPAAARRYWDDSNTQKELYRERTRLGVSGEEAHVDGEELTDFMFEARALLDLVCAGPLRRAAMSPSGVPYTYFIHEATSAEPTPEESHLGLPLVRPTSFEGRPTKLFLEGAVHWMKDRPGDAAAVHEAVCRSPLYDRKLKMFKSCESMEGESYELGRAVGAYPPGWIENESVYLHMEYKYLLELIRSGEPEAFWEAARTALVPFCDPAVYGRSTLEGASFLVSSAYEDPREHGRAYQPRLSGITCEMLHMWVIAVAGPRPFDLDTDGRLRLALDPALPGWLFTEAPRRASYHDAGNGWKDLEIPAGALAFKLLNRALVVYHNPERRETYGGSGVRPVSYRLLYRSGEQVEIRAPSVGAPHAEAVRDGAVARIDVELS